MFLAEPNLRLDPNDMEWLENFCEVWLCDINSACWDNDYDYADDDIINFKDMAQYVEDYGWHSDTPDFTEKRFYYLKDALGSVMGLVGAKLKRQDNREFYLYNAYGQPQGNEESKAGNPYGFTGRRYDSETGLYYYRARYYDNYTGR
jgi:hypothetical protein